MSRKNLGWSLLHRFHGFWFFELDPFIIGLYRACLGLFLLFFFLLLGPSWLEYYGPNGISVFKPLRWRDYALFDPLLFYVTTDFWMWAFYGAGILAAVCLCAGILPRLAAVWLWLSAASLIHRNPYVVNGEEEIVSVLLFFTMFLPLGESLRFDELLDPAKRRAMFSRRAKVRVWSLRALQVHVMLMYLLSFPAKLGWDESWWDGTAIYYAMMHMNYPRWPGLEVFAWGDAVLSRVLTYYTLLVEGLCPFLIWFRRLRVPCTLGLMALHLGIAVFLEGVAVLNLAMLVGLVCFLPSSTTREGLCRLLYREPAAQAGSERGRDEPESATLTSAE